MKDMSGHRHLWLDLVALGRALRPRSTHVSVTNFTAPVLDDSPILSRQTVYQQTLVAQNPGLLTVVNGRYSRKTKTCHNCHKTWTHYEEEETDVSIATTLLLTAAEAKADTILLVSADSDLAPAVRIAKRWLGPTFLAAAFPPSRYSSELKSLMPASFPIGRTKITGSQLPKTVLDSRAGILYRKPAKWV